MSARIEFAGTAAAPGMVLGRARVLYPLHFEVEAQKLAPGALSAEALRLSRALADARKELGVLAQNLARGLKRELGELLEAHVALLDDPMLEQELQEHIVRAQVSAEGALAIQREHLVELFAGVDDPYLQSRREDLEQALARIYAVLRRGGVSAPRRHGAGTVLVAETLSPAELLHAHEHGLVGLVLSSGSPHAHAAILSRSLKLPQVVHASAALAGIRDGDLTLVDGDVGRVIVHPDALDLKRLRAYQAEAESARRRRARLRNAETVTADGVPITLLVNAETGEDIAAGRRVGAHGIGLYRSELLFLRGGATDELTQYRAYRDAVLAMPGRPVVLRTVDLGADKAIEAGLALHHEDNPALGLRGVRYSLHDRELFALQLRAMLRASAFGPVSVLLPMLTCVREAREARALLESCRRELESERVPLGDEVQLGGMIETPAAALDCAELLGELDFIAIGSNDLTQYTLAVDRNHALLSAAYDPLHPTVIRLIAATVDAARAAGKPVTLCGEIAGDLHALPLLLAIGLTRFSVRADAVLPVREALRSWSCKALRARRKRLLGARTREALEAMLP